ncbi:hypothetical protein ACFVKB_36920 [Rhodococcus sp. NPDC127530]|uniref:hypothetical protein n=1 Tax=unclassified Rhodococcus (in: high G+C Gram-positive bacteria) TaxID=192944 RepID=UPI00362BDEC5
MSRFLRLAVVASTAAAAAAALSLTAAHAHATPAPSGCDIQFFAVGAMSTCAPGSVNTHQLELVCYPFTNLIYPVNTITVWGPEVPTFLPSIALCPPPIYFALGPLRDTRVHTR